MLQVEMASAFSCKYSVLCLLSPDGAGWGLSFRTSLLWLPLHQMAQGHLRGKTPSVLRLQTLAVDLSSSPWESKAGESGLQSILDT